MPLTEPCLQISCTRLFSQSHFTVTDHCFDPAGGLLVLDHADEVVGIAHQMPLTLYVGFNTFFEPQVEYIVQEDVLAMDNIKEAKKKIQIQRTFSYSRLAPELMSAAYESLVPIKRMPLSAEQRTKTFDVKEERQWAI